jgi:hypothetical protein
MPASRLLRVLGTVLVVLTIPGCSTLLPNGGLPAGARRLAITVDNKSAQPAVVLVADGRRGDLPGPAVGRAVPNLVPPSSVVDVVFDVPPGPFWMIWVNQSAIVSSGDVPRDAVGATPIRIDIGPDGNLSSGLRGQDLPGWFGD